MPVTSGGVDIAQLALLGGGLCLLLVALVVGLFILVKLVGLIRSLAGKVVLVGCYLIVLFGCCLLLIGAVLSAPRFPGG